MGCDSGIGAGSDVVSQLKQTNAGLVAEIDRLRVSLLEHAPRRFPIQGGPSIPWRVIAPHEAQAQRNHDQSLERLAERGGLSPAEALLVLDDKPLRRADWKALAVEGLARLDAINAGEDGLQQTIVRLNSEVKTWQETAEEKNEGCEQLGLTVIALEDECADLKEDIVEWEDSLESMVKSRDFHARVSLYQEEVEKVAALRCEIKVLERRVEKLSKALSNAADHLLDAERCDAADVAYEAVSGECGRC